MRGAELIDPLQWARCDWESRRRSNPARGCYKAWLSYTECAYYSHTEVHELIDLILNYYAQHYRE